MAKALARRLLYDWARPTSQEEVPMNRIIAIAIATATIVSAAANAATAAEAERPTKAPRVDAQQVEADRAFVRTVGILGMLNEGDATQTVLQSAMIGAQLDGAMRGLEGRRYASTGFSVVRRAQTPDRSVSLGAIQMESARDFELADHRSHRPKAR
jgi:hypothetical protein